MRCLLWMPLFVIAPFVLGAQCQGGVGDPCTPEDEQQPYFSGFSASEVNVESRSFQCETRVCLVNHFQGRVSCPYGQTEAVATNAANVAEKLRCHVPGRSDAEGRVMVAVSPQLVSRRPNDAVYCSCRCDGPDPHARYCACPDGFECAPLLPAVEGLALKELSGSYCIKKGTATVVRGSECTPGSCGAPDGT